MGTGQLYSHPRTLTRVRVGGVALTLETLAAQGWVRVGRVDRVKITQNFLAERFHVTPDSDDMKQAFQKLSYIP
jgi:hypothetical protein